MDFRRFLGELKQRNVVRVAGVYTVSAWGVFQVAKTVIETLELPKAISVYLLLILALGLPVVLVLSWGFERGADGVIRRARSTPDAAARKLTPLDWGIMAAIAGAAVAFVVTAVSLIGAVTPGGMAGLGADRSVAVLPFANFGAEGDDAYFADGLTEEVINSLARVPDLKVAGRTSAFYFKGKNEDLREIGRKLNVAHVVEGSVRRSGPRLRVTTQLVSVKDGYHLWSQTYDRTVEDAFAIQTEIAEGVADALKVELKAGDAPKAGKRDPRAYELELVAKGQVRRKGKAQLQAAQDIYRRLVEMEPDNAQVHADYAYTSAYLVQNYLEGDFLPVVREAESEIAKALALDPKSSSAYVAKGMVAMIRLVREGRQAAEGEAEAAFRRAVELDPKNPEALSLLGDFLASRDPVEAVPILERALDIDPLDRLANNAVAGALFATGRIDEAEQRYRSNVQLFPEFVDSRQLLADLLSERGRMDLAVPWYISAAAPHTDPSASFELANRYYNLGMPREAQAALASWREHPIAGPLCEVVPMLVARDFEGVLAFSQKKLAIGEPDPIWRSGIAQSAMMLGRNDLAREQLVILSPELFQAVPQIGGGLANDAVAAAWVIRETGDKAQAQRILEAVIAATPERPGRRSMSPRRIARIKAFAMLGETDKALAELRAAIDGGYRQLYDVDAFIRLDEYPMLATLRRDRRFQAMIKEIETDNARMRQSLVKATPT